MVYVGVDLHRKSSYVAVLADNGELLASRRIASQPDEFLRVFGELEAEPAGVAFEATYGWGWFADLLSDIGIPAHMAHPLATKAISAARVKNDRVDAKTLAHLASTLRGDLLRPEDPTYEQLRKVWNGSIDRYPALIVRCAGVADVIEAVRFARSHRLLVAVRSGGHSYPGLSVCDEGMVIDLGLMKGVRVDPEARTVRAQAGTLLGDLDREAQAFGLAIPAGFVSHTGLAGLTLGGGSATSCGSSGSRSTRCSPSTRSRRTASS